MRSRIAGALAMMGLCLLLARCSAPSPAVRHAEADAAYAAAILACVDDAGSLAQSHACRARVDLAWGVQRPATVPPHMLAQPAKMLDGGERFDAAGLREMLLSNVYPVVDSGSDQ